ncbi:MAG TPA: carboxypeptidase-like regulatory domain-containing protein [Thermoanaerobaculia bacterium]|nr:carboxypeptidase-like regulatory domain-containing protein [Thermoanaerobaculia bacterium]
MAGTARSDGPVPPLLAVLGNVTTSARPVANALIIALNLADFEAVQTFSGIDGTFTLPKLRTGVYKIIAVKQGFVPAMTMLVPTHPENRITIKLQNERNARGARDVNQEIWEIRGSLPPDILHELDQVLAQPVKVAYDVPRIRGEMVSMTGVAPQSASTPSVAQTALGVQGRIGENWQVGIRGNLHRIDDPTDDQAFGSPAAQSSVMSMELRSSPTDAYRVASTKSFWRYRDDLPVSDHQADYTAQNFEWQHGVNHVAVRYFAQQNLFESNPSGSDLIEIAGDTTVLQTRRGDVGVSLRVAQESMRNSANATLRTADVNANASFELVPAFILHYGMASRLGLDGTQWAPRTGVEWKIGNTSLIANGMYKVWDQSRGPLVLPSIVVWTDDSRLMPRYSYSFGVVSGDNDGDRASAIATVSAVDTPVRMIFSDGFEPFWDGMYVDSGDIRRDLRLAYRKDIAHKLAIDVSTSAGTATPTHSQPFDGNKVYITGDLQSTWTPTGTSLAVSYRELQQPQRAGTTYKSERVNLRMSQSLRLPIDLKLLFGLELAHAQNSPYLFDVNDLDGATRKYMGGLAVNF